MTMYAGNELGWILGGRAVDRRWKMCSIDLGPLFGSVCVDRLRGQKFENRCLRGFRLIGQEQMAGVFEQDEPCPGNARRDQFPVSRRAQPVGLAVNDEGWSRDLGQAAERFPREYGLQLSKIAGRAGRPG